MYIYYKEVEQSLDLEIATVRKGQDITSNDLANRLMPFMRDLLERVRTDAYREGFADGRDEVEL